MYVSLFVFLTGRIIDTSSVTLAIKALKGKRVPEMYATSKKNI